MGWQQAEQCLSRGRRRKRQHVPHVLRSTQFVTRRNNRERVRVHGINHAFDTLRHHVPHISSDDRASKISILRQTCNYIMHLTSLLQGSCGTMFPEMLHSERGRECVTTVPDSTSFSPRTEAHSEECEQQHRGECEQDYSGDCEQRHRGECGQRQRGECEQDYSGESEQRHRGEFVQQHRGECEAHKEDVAGTPANNRASHDDWPPLGTMCHTRLLESQSIDTMHITKLLDRQSVERTSDAWFDHFSATNYRHMTSHRAPLARRHRSIGQETLPTSCVTPIHVTSDHKLTSQRHRFLWPCADAMLADNVDSASPDAVHRLQREVLCPLSSLFPVTSFSGVTSSWSAVTPQTTLQTTDGTDVKELWQGDLVRPCQLSPSPSYSDVNMTDVKARPPALVYADVTT